MSTPRLHLETHLAAGLEIEAEPGQAHHLSAVLRRGVGDAVLVFNAEDGEWAGRIAALRKDRCRIALEAQNRAPAPEPDLRLMVAATPNSVAFSTSHSMASRFRVATISRRSGSG
ncbi:MAG: RNA methyltransferase PUA domain-containing protein, partial [Alphaproteobacteria bacterium]